MAAGGDEPRRRTKRSKDRPEQIITAAARLFCERGYHLVSLDDIGEAVGITGPAVYRHFDSKEALLVTVAERMVDRYSATFMDAVQSTETPEDRLVALVECTVGSQVEEVNFWAASSELKHISRDLTRYIDKKRRAAVQYWIDVLVDLHPNLSAKEANFLVEAGTSLTTPTLVYYQPQLSRGRVIDVLSRMLLAGYVLGPDELLRNGRDASRVRPDDPEGGAESPSDDGRRRSSARERLLGVAVSLFREYGFRATGIDEIGTAAGVTGPAVYRHFRNKDDILFNAMSRANERLAIGVSRSLAGAPTSEEALERLVESYLDAVIGDTDLMAVYWSQREALEPTQRAGIDRGERSYVHDWVGVLTEVRTDIDEAEARTMVYAALGLMNGYWQAWSAPLPGEQARRLLHAVVSAALTKS